MYYIFMNYMILYDIICIQIISVMCSFHVLWESLRVFARTLVLLTCEAEELRRENEELKARPSPNVPTMDGFKLC